MRQIKRTIRTKQSHKNKKKVNKLKTGLIYLKKINFLRFFLQISIPKQLYF